MKIWITKRYLRGSAAFAAVIVATAFIDSNALAQETHFSRTYSKVTKSYLQQCVDKTNTPGGGLLIFDTSKETRFFRHGYENIELKRRYKEDTRTTIHSISKIFAGIIAMQLVEEGKLDLDKSIDQYLPAVSFRNDYQTIITTRQLLSHTSGLPHENEHLATGIANALDAPNIHFVFPPGEEGKRSYSNTAFAIAGVIFEALDGRSLDEMVRQRITEPLRMEKTMLGADPFDPTLATQYMPSRYDLVFNMATPLAPVVRPRFEHLAAGVTSTLFDLAILGRLLLGRGSVGDVQLMREKTFSDFAEITAPGDSYDQAQGVRYITLKNGKKIVGHSGTWAGGRTSMFVAPELGFGIAAFVNSVNRCDAADLSYRLFEAAYAHANGRKPLSDYDAGDADIQAITTVSNADDYAGIWKTYGGRQLVFSAQKDRLYLVHDGQKQPVEHSFDYHRDALVRSGEAPGRYLFDFRRTEEGGIASLVVGPDLFVRDDATLPRQKPLPPEWQGLIGHYRNDSAAPHGFEVYARNGKLYRRSYWWDGEAQLKRMPNLDEKSRLAFLLDDGDDKNIVEFVLLGETAVYAILNGAPFERSWIDSRMVPQE